MKLANKIKMLLIGVSFIKKHSRDLKFKLLFFKRKIYNEENILKNKCE